MDLHQTTSILIDWLKSLCSVFPLNSWVDCVQRLMCGWVLKTSLWRESTSGRAAAHNPSTPTGWLGTPTTGAIKRTVWPWRLPMAPGSTLTVKQNMLSSVKPRKLQTSESVLWFLTSCHLGRVTLGRTHWLTGCKTPIYFLLTPGWTHWLTWRKTPIYLLTYPRMNALADWA